MYIKSKSTGLSLYDHSTGVIEACMKINKLGNYNLNEDILYWFGLAHDLGKANPLFQSNMDTQNFDNICRHEISSILFCNIIPEEIRDTVVYLILSHHKSLRDTIDDTNSRAFYNLWDGDEDMLMKNHVKGISEWGKNVQAYLKEYYNIDASIPTEEECRNIFDKYFNGTKTLNCEPSLYRGVTMMGDHFASCYWEKSERDKQFEKLYLTPNVDYYNGKDERYPLSMIDSDKSKKHTLVIAPTGCGKTNFMMKRATKRVFYTLPFQASINAMFKRLKGDIGEDLEFGLKHGSYNNLDFIDETTKTLSNFFGLPLKVITPFQIMTLNLGLKGYESIIADLQGQDVILDEIHTYSGITQAYVLNLIKCLVKIGCNIHICTATIPTVLKNKILELLGEDNVQLVTLTDEQLDSFNRHKIHCINDKNIEQLIKEHYENNEKVLIVRNQVGKAQKTYDDILNDFPDANVLLLHSKFKRGMRNELEDKLYEYNKSDKPCIVVSTQVVEVSLDINFDVLFTDCADIMCLIQRFGRINRQRKNIGIIKDVYVVDASQDSKPYDTKIVQDTWNALQEYNNKVLPEKDVIKLIDKVHTAITTSQDIGNALNENNEWILKSYTNITNTSIARTLDIKGYIGIVEEDRELYLNERDSDLEVPLNEWDIKPLVLLSNSKEFNGIYLIPMSKWNPILGYQKKK